MKKKELFESYAGNLAQIGGTRHYVLIDGWGRNLRAIDVNSGSGLRYTILPDRGLDISLASFKGTNFVYLTPNGETHPSFYEHENFGWLRTFTGGLLTTCGLTHVGAPADINNQHYGLHGRYSTTPAKQVADMSDWVDDEYHIKIKGVVEEAYLFGNKLRLEREISTIQGENKITISDKITNFGATASPYMILYHMNLGYPLLSEDAELIIDPLKTEPRDAEAEKDINNYKRFIKPQTGFSEQVYFHSMKIDDDGFATVTLQNKSIGFNFTVKFDGKTLPFLTQWKMMGKGEYVLGLEPCNILPKDRLQLVKDNKLPFLESGKTITNKLIIIISDI